MHPVLIIIVQLAAMPEVRRKDAASPKRSPRGSPLPTSGGLPRAGNRDNGQNMLMRSVGLMSHRSIISMGAAQRGTPFGTLTAEESEMLKRTLDDRRRAWQQPGAEPLSKARALAILKRKEQRSVMISQLIAFTLYAVVYMSALLMQRPILESHDLEGAIEAVFVDQQTSTASGGFTFEQIASHADVFTWMEEVFLPVVYTDTWYNGDDRDDLDEHTIGAQTVFVGGFRLLQVRGGDGHGSRCYDSIWSQIQPRCLDYEESQETYGPSTEGFTYSCDPSDDEICGFYIDFAIGNHTFPEQIDRLQALKTGRWLDESTRYLYIDTSMYLLRRPILGLVSMIYKT